MVLKHYREVAAALRDPRFGITGGSVDADAHRATREQARKLYSPERIAQWRTQFILSARSQHTPSTGEIELVRDFAEPYSLALAGLVTGLDAAAVRELTPLAQVIFDAAEGLAEATITLASRFAPADAALHTQAFVALAVSLPAFLGNAFVALLENRDQFGFLAAPGAVNELLRFAGPSLIQTRVYQGQSVELHLAIANRDPEQFADPDRLDLTRDASGHLAFGAGPHACVGAALVKAASSVILPIFAERFRDSHLIRSQAYGGRTIRGHRVYVL